MNTISPSTALTNAQENTRAALLMIVAMAAFAVEDLTWKISAMSMPPGQVLILSGFLGGSIFAALGLRKGDAIFSRQAFKGSILWRNFAEGLSAFFFIMVLAVAELSFASAMLQAAPLVVTAGAAMFLGETVGWRRWSSIIVGLIGVLIVIAPWHAGFDPIGLLMIASIVAVAGRDLITRRLPKSVSSMQLSAWGLYSVVPAGALLMLVQGHALVLPDLEIFLTLLIGIAFGAAGYYLIVTAMRMGEVSVVAPFRYTRLIFGVMLGMAFLGERPTANMIVGAIIVTASGLYILSRERKRKAALAPKA